MSLREAILAAALAIPTGTTSLAGQTVKIRGLTQGEEEELLSDGVKTAAIPVCAICIIDDDGKPLFTADEIKSFKGGLLKGPYLDILNLTYPKKGKPAKNS